MAPRKPHPARFMEYPMLDQSEPVSASDMRQEFRDDEDEARERYGERRLDVEGVVEYNGPDMFGLPSLELSDSDEGSCEVLCVFEDEADLEGIEKSDVVTVRGNFIDCVPDYGPTLKNCEVVAAGTAA